MGRVADGAGRRARDAHRSRGGARSESRVASLAAAESRRVRQRGARAARARHRRRRVSAARYPGARLRQHLRRAGRVDRGDGRLPARRQRDQPSGGRRSQRVDRPRRSTSCRATARRCGMCAGAPMGTRGGVSVVHIFPADGEYVFKMLLHSGPTGDLFGGGRRRRADRGVGQRRARGRADHQPH